MKKRRLVQALALAPILAAPTFARAETYPARPVKIVVPYVAGGTVDLVARVLAQKLSEQMGQPFVVENRPGASGLIGSEAVTKAPPDGYTLLLQSPTLVASPLIMKKTPYDVKKDFTAISLLGSVPMVVVAYPGTPGTNLREFLDAARANPEKFAFGTSATGSPMHLAQEAIKRGAKLDVPIIIYKGTAAALTDVLGGQISALIDAIPSSAPNIASGKLRPLAVTTRQRLPSMPEVPTVAESGLPGFEMVSWYGLWAPARLPGAITSRLASEVETAMNSLFVGERLKPQSFVSASSTPAAFSAFLDKETANYARIIREADIRPE
ncbi:tripartite tricarboxylate transporter substrate binding protein [Variovorax ginsengisoli]|uniref:Tripartite-type tricarboxylate transporter receptor subunit TctC n=1 Tax=Variovorax ginsengisoli TaxID=363844 RepID=A0ABT9SBN6_9BURK|nr:tripartite tricarboxylate transporter substrate binding protein [Variovorax ginsengisoli]MDP9900812.1 tripartite-type tricarboxylate transporter receptor subunit TctC [Variovorax ginsengisoli]